MPINLDSYNTKVDEIKSTMVEASEQPAKNSPARIKRVVKEAMAIYNSLADTYFAVKTWVDGQLATLSSQISGLTDSVSDTNDAIDAVEAQIIILEDNADSFLLALDGKASVVNTYTKGEVDVLISASSGKPTVHENVTSEAVMLSLTAFKGDFALRTDITQTFILADEPATNINNWVQIEISAVSDATKQNISEKNQALGYAGLDAQSKLASSQIPTILEFKQVHETRQQITIADATLTTIDLSLGTYVEINITSSVAINIAFSGTTSKYGFAVLKITGNAQNINLPAGTTQPDVDGYSSVNLVVPRTKTGTQRLTIDYANDTYYVSPSSTV